MSENLRVDRYLENQAMDHIDHALGRPLDPLGETYRNFYATGSRRFDGDPIGARHCRGAWLAHPRCA